MGLLMLSLPLLLSSSLSSRVLLYDWYSIRILKHSEHDRQLLISNKELDTERADTQAPTSWPLEVAAFKSLCLVNFQCRETKA